MKKNFLGRGWRHPIGVDAQGGTAMSSADDNIEQAIRVLLGTAIGERVMRPDFGCYIHDYVFYPNNASTAALVAYYAAASIRKWEPRVDELEVRAYPDRSAENRLLIDISYRVISENNRRNLVYPFYLRREQDL